MKILHISGARGWGGNEQQLIDMIPELTKLGIHSIVLGIHNSLLQKECEEKKIKFVVAKANKLNKFTNYRFLKTLTTDLKPDLIHLHTSDSLTVFTISDLLFNLNVKAVFSKKGMGNSSSILSKYKYNYKNVSKIICVSKAVKDSFSKIIFKNNLSKLEVIYDGINLNRTNPVTPYILKEKYSIKQENFILGNIANHVKAKDLTTLIKAIHHLVFEIEMKNVHLFQIGSFSDKLTPELKNIITELQLDSFITLTGFQPHALGFLEQFDIYVMSSEREGLPLTIFEAFLKKTPVVSTTAGGIPEAILHDDNGFLCDVSDFKSLAKWIKVLLNNNEKCNEFAEKSYKMFFEKFTAEKNAQNVQKLYKKILAE